MRNLLIFLSLLLFNIVSANAQVNVHRNLPAVDFLEERLEVPIKLIPNYRDVMRDIISDLSIYAKGRNPKFDILAREGLYLLFKGEWEEQLDELRKAQAMGMIYDEEKFIAQLFRNEEEAPHPIGTPIRRYLQNIDGVVINGMFCENNPPDNATMKIINDEGLNLFGVEHCSDAEALNKAVTSAVSQKIVLHIDNDFSKKYDTIPNGKILLENPQNIDSLNNVRNMLLITDSKRYGSRGEWVFALSETNYDMLIIDPFHKGREALTKEDITMLKFKKLGARRKVIARVSLTEAEDFRFYWQRGWRLNNPSWLLLVSKDNPAALVVEYWNPQWKEIIGNYVRGILDLGFDGIMFDGLDAHMRFERLTPID